MTYPFTFNQNNQSLPHGGTNNQGGATGYGSYNYPSTTQNSTMRDHFSRTGNMNMNMNNNTLPSSMNTVNPSSSGNLQSYNQQNYVQGPNVYKTGTFDHHFTPFITEEMPNNRQCQVKIFNISLNDKFLNFSAEELRAIDYQLKKQNQRSTPQFNRVEQNPQWGNNSRPTIQANTSSSMNNDISRYLNPTNSNGMQNGMMGNNIPQYPTGNQMQNQSKVVPSFYNSSSSGNNQFKGQEPQGQRNQFGWSGNGSSINNTTTQPQIPYPQNSTSSTVGSSNANKNIIFCANPSTSNTFIPNKTLNVPVTQSGNAQPFYSNASRGLSTPTTTISSACPTMTSFAKDNTNNTKPFSMNQNIITNTLPSHNQVSFDGQKNHFKSNITLNQERSANNMYEVVSKMNNHIPSDDYLGIKEMCKGLTRAFEHDSNKLTTREIEEAFGLDDDGLHKGKKCSTIGHTDIFGNENLLGKNGNDFNLYRKKVVTFFPSTASDSYMNGSGLKVKNKESGLKFNNYFSSNKKAFEDESIYHNSSIYFKNKNQNLFTTVQRSYVKPLTVDDILPLNNKKKNEPSDTSTFNKENLKTKDNILHLQASKGIVSSKADYTTPTDNLQELEKLAQEAYEKGVGSFSQSFAKGKLAMKSESKKTRTEMKVIPEALEDNLNNIDSNKPKEKMGKLSDEAGGGVHEEMIREENNDGLLKLKLKVVSPINFDMSVSVNRRNKIRHLKEATREILQKQFPKDFSSLSVANIVMCIKTGILKDNEVIHSKDFLNEREVIQIFIEDMETNVENSREWKVKEELEELEMSSISGDESSLAEFVSVNEKMQSTTVLNKQLNKEYRPFSVKYSTEPPMKELDECSQEELEKVYNFSVFNEHGRITFKGYSDVTYLNLDEIIQISPFFISVYDHSTCPEYGKKLNKEARLVMKNMYLPPEAKESEEAYAEFLFQIKEKLEKRKAQFLDYNSETMELTFEVKAFDIVKN